jgi:hypothetical protein
MSATIATTTMSATIATVSTTMSATMTSPSEFVFIETYVSAAMISHL